MKKEEFINKYVRGWLKRDFERMINDIPVLPNEAGNIGFFLALSALVSMEALGGFLRGEEGNFNKNVEEYINKCFEYPKEYPIEILTDIYRNGLAHEFFPRGAITRTKEEIRPAIFRDKKIGVVLNAEVFANDFLKSLIKFSEVLTDENYQKRCIQMEDKIKNWVNEKKEAIDNLIEKDAPSFSTSTTNVTSSPQGENSQISAYPAPSMYPREEE